MQNKAGLFITTEGIEGVGKSSHIPLIEQFFTDNGWSVLVTREPGGTPLGESLRSLLLEHKKLSICDDSELLMMFAARAEHLAQVIKPALQAGKCVICDRFTDSTFAYQGGGRGIPQQKIAVIEEWVQGALQPDLTLLFDAPVGIALARAAKRSAKDRIEDQALSFFEKVRQSFLQRAADYPERFRLIDAKKTYMQVETELRVVLQDFIAE